MFTRQHAAVWLTHNLQNNLDTRSLIEFTNRQTDRPLFRFPFPFSLPLSRISVQSPAWIAVCKLSCVNMQKSYFCVCVFLYPSPALCFSQLLSLLLCFCGWGICVACKQTKAGVGLKVFHSKTELRKYFDYFSCAMIKLIAVTHIFLKAHWRRHFVKVCVSLIVISRFFFHIYFAHDLLHSWNSLLNNNWIT